MNKAITEGLVLMPPAFAAGLNLWSREDGRPGQGSYDAQPNAAYVPSDQDFGGCLELQKTSATQKLRCFQQIPIQPGLYLRVTAKVKAISGALPSLRIAAWAGSSFGTNVTSAVQTGPAVPLTAYGAVVTVSAIIGSGNRQGVDMVWGTAPVYGHFGLDLTGATGGVVRIDDIVIEDVTSVFHADMFDWVDVRDFGAVGDGVTDDRAAFDAADTAALGKTVVVSPGNYFIASHLTFENPVKFEGTITMPDAQRLACTRNYNLDTYAAAFGSELLGFKKALQALFYFTDHVSLDLNGRRVELTEPIDVAALAGLTTFTQRRLLSHGQFTITPGAPWTTQTLTSVASYDPAQPTTLTGVVNVAAIPVGARISGSGVGREVYVKSKNVGAGTVQLSQPLWGGAGTRSYTFQRYKYMLDFSGFSDLSKFEITGIEFLCNNGASGVNLPVAGKLFRFADCTFNSPKDRAITSTGAGCQGMNIESCQFQSWEFDLRSQDRVTVGFNVNANDSKIRNNRAAYFAHFGVLGGGSHIMLGNHIFAEDNETLGLRRAGLVFTTRNVRGFIVGNYIDNCFIELSNEHDEEPDFISGYSFGGLTITGNLFLVSNAAASFCFLVVAPKGTGHSLSGLSVANNVFRNSTASIDRVEMLDTSVATLNFGNFRNVTFEGNSFNGVTQATVSPLFIEHNQNTAADTWVVNGAAYLPFGGRARNVSGLVAEGAITNASNAAQFVTPYVQVEQGAGLNLVNVKWPSLVKGRVHLTIRCDNPL
jgi:hypothetical protein